MTAAATGVREEQLRQLPKYPVFRRFQPTIYAFDSSYLAVRPDLHLLHYNGPGTRLRR